MKARGFILVVVLIGVVAVSGAVLIQLNTAQATRVTSVRQRENTKARGHAERCLNLGERIARSYLANSGALDFDCLLDPTCNGVDDDNFIPDAADMGGSSVVYIPKGESASAEPRRGAHRFRYMPVSGGGGCYLRFQDNADEFQTAARFDDFTNNTAPGEEGPLIGAEVLSRDRDRTIVITSIGVHPQRGATPGDYYDQAHARVTLRRAFGADPIGDGAIVAGGEVNIGQSAAICGNGSVSAGPGSNLDLGNNGCMCGDALADTCTGTCPLPGCGGCGSCNDPTPSTGPTSGPPTVNIPTASFAGAVALESFAKDLEGTTNLGTNGVCELWFRGGGVGEVFYWDHEDLANSCDSYATDPVEPPCALWNVATDPATPTCAAGESPCWKLAARFDGSPVATGQSATLINSSPTRNGWDLEARFNGVTNTPWSTFCGGCTNCGAANDTVTYDDATDSFLLEDTWDNGDFPTPSYVYIENPAGQDFVFNGNEGTNTWAGGAGPLQVTWISNQGIDLDANGGSNLCGAECDCTNLTNAGGFTCAVSDAQLPPASERTCAVLRAAGRCDLQSGNDRVFGAIQCQEVVADGAAPCLVGDIVATGPGPGGHDCTSGAMPGYCAQTAICFENNGAVIGDLRADGNICMKNGGVINGDIETTHSFFAKNNSTLNGSVRATQDVDIGNSVTINAIGGAGPGLGNLNLFRFVESPW